MDYRHLLSQPRKHQSYSLLVPNRMQAQDVTFFEQVWLIT